jgi:hypothetical protein
MIQVLKTRLLRLPASLVAALLLALLVAMLWLPFGINVGFTGDDWIYFHQADAGILMMAASPLRLFQPLPWLIGYALAPGHFAGINLCFALLMFGKGYLVYAILNRLTAPRPLAFAAAVLSLLLPADIGVFSMEALSIQFAVVCYLLALYLLILYRDRPRFSLLLGMWISLVGCVATYEVVYPLILFSPLVLLLRHKFNRRFIGTTLLWYLVPALNAVWFVWIIVNFPRAFAYQGGRVTGFSLSAIMISLFNIYKRHFVDGWLQGRISANSLYLLLAVLSALAIGGVCVLLWRREPIVQRSRLPLIFAVSGLVIIGLGVALYLPTDLRDETFRTYYFSSIGAALTLAVLFWWVARRPWVFALLVGVFVSLGTIQLLDQHQRYRDESLREQSALRTLVQALPAVAAGSGIVVIDETPHSEFIQTVRGFRFEYIMATLYQDYSLESALCSPGEFGTSEQSRCRFTGDGIVIPSIRSRYFVRPYAQLIFVRYDGVFSVVNDLTPYTGAPVADYHPERLYNAAAPLPSRIADLFGH